jgi:hypothetical protein
LLVLLVVGCFVSSLLRGCVLGVGVLLGMETGLVFVGVWTRVTHGGFW